MSLSSKEYRRLYRREHPLALWFTLGVAFAGLVALIAPETVETSATYLALPEWLRNVFNVSYAVGGLVSFFGILRVRHNIEAAGEAILASALVTQFLSVLYVHPTISASFILFLAIGCARRSIILSEK